MTSDESQVKREEWIIDYLYGELNDEQKKVFEQTLETDAQLKKLYDEHTLIDALIPKGSQPQITDERMQGVRWAALRGIRQGHRPTLWERITQIWQVQVPMKLQVASMAMMFVAGFLISDIGGKTPAAEDTTIVKSAGVFDLVKDDDYEIVDLVLDAYDQSKGDVKFSFALASKSEVQGNIENPQIRSLLAKSLKTESSDDVRLDLTDLFANYAHNKDVKDALIYTLLNDPNPGVRYNAVEHLIKMSDDKDVKHALRHAMVHDVNNGIRVEAFLTLTEEIDEKMLEILQQHSVHDANTLIRERSRRILENYTPLNGESENSRSI